MYGAELTRSKGHAILTEFVCELHGRLPMLRTITSLTRFCQSDAGTRCRSYGQSGAASRSGFPATGLYRAAGRGGGDGEPERDERSISQCAMRLTQATRGRGHGKDE